MNYYELYTYILVYLIAHLVLSVVSIMLAMVGVGGGSLWPMLSFGRLGLCVRSALHFVALKHIRLMSGRVKKLARAPIRCQGTHERWSASTNAA